jgi:hypothetical protein
MRISARFAVPHLFLIQLVSYNYLFHPCACPHTSISFKYHDSNATNILHETTDPRTHAVDLFGLTRLTGSDRSPNTAPNEPPKRMG